MKKNIYWNETKATTKVALPLIAANLVQASSGFIGTVMLARLGSEPLAASGLVSSLYFMLVVIFWGMLSGISVLISQAHGANEPTKINRLMQQGIFFGGLISIPMMLALWLLPYSLKSAVQSPVLLDLATQYMHAMVWIVIPGSAFVLVEQLLIGLQKSTVVMVLSVLSVPLEIAGSYVLIFGKLGMPQCGISGLGYAIGFAYSLVAILGMLYISWQKDLRQYRAFHGIPRLEMRFLKEVVRIGWPIGAMYGIEVSAFAVMALMIGRIGAEALDAHQIVMQYLGAEIMVSFAFMNATSIRVGYAIGAKDYSMLPCIGHVGMLLSAAIAVIVGITYVMFPTAIVSLDLDIHQANGSMILALTSKLLLIAIFYQLAEAVRIAAMGALRGMKDTRFPMINSFISFWVIGISLSMVFGIGLNGQAVGIWLGTTIGIICGAVILAIRYQRLATRYSVVA